MFNVQCGRPKKFWFVNLLSMVNNPRFNLVVEEWRAAVMEEEFVYGNVR